MEEVLINKKKALCTTPLLKTPALRNVENLKGIFKI